MNMVKKWKAASTALGLMVAASTLLSACGGDSSKAGSSSSADAVKDNGQPYEVAMAFVTLNDLPDVGLVQDEISKISKAKINATVKLIPISIANWTQQTNLMLAGNEKLDLMVSSSFFNYASQVAKGQLEPMDDLLNKYGKGIVDALGQDVLNGSKVDGKVYGVADLRDMGADYGIIMRKDLVDKYNIDLSKIKSWSELDPVFQTIKDKEPSMAPLVQQTSQRMPASNIFNVNYDSIGDDLGALVDPSKSTKFVNYFETKEYRDAVNLARKWYQAGYIMKDIATSQEAGANLVKAGKAFSYFSNMKPGFEQQESNLTGTPMVAVRLTPVLQKSDAINSFMMSITKNSENKEKAMQFLNLLYTDKDVMNLMALGIEGKHYVKTKDNMIKLPDGVKQSGYQFNQWEVGNNFLTYVWEGTDPNIWELTKQHNKNGIKSKALGFSWNADPVKTEVAAATNVMNQYKAGLESGTLDPALIDEFNAKLKAAGLDKIIAEKQKQFDAWLKTASK